MPEELLPCPCCDAKAVHDSKEISGGGYSDGHTVYSVRCTRCGINTGSYSDHTTPARVWNKRPAIGSGERKLCSKGM